MHYTAKCEHRSSSGSEIRSLTDNTQRKKKIIQKKPSKKSELSSTRRQRKATGTFLQLTLSLVSSIMLRLSRDRGLKALKQSTKLLFLFLRRPNDALKTYTQLLAYNKSVVSGNYSEKTINGILDYVGGGKVEVDVLKKFYRATKDALVEAKNEVRQSRMRSRPRPHASQPSASLKTNLKLAKLWLDRKEFGRLSKVCIFSFYSPSMY